MTTASALPLPRRYTTWEPLADGLYLYAEAQRPDVWFSARIRENNVRWNFAVPGLTYWLIGPITIPDLPSEETSS